MKLKGDVKQGHADIWIFGYCQSGDGECCEHFTPMSLTPRNTYNFEILHTGGRLVNCTSLNF